ncbi:MAG: pectinesterase family protein [Bythopirellula sp.]|nr:pectinesterase family protein [Bythopirellula sp.]
MSVIRLSLHLALSASLMLFAFVQTTAADVHFTVGPSEQYTTVSAAVNAVPVNNTERHIIDILPGTYMERVIIPSDKPFITLRGGGANASDTILTFNETANTPPNESTVHASTVIRGRDFIGENLTFANSYGPGVQALAIYARGDRAIFNNCRFLGYQDTLRSESGRHYFYNSYVEGTVDFIYGKGTAYFENSTLFAKASGYVTAQAREQAAETNGYVFKNSTITGTAANGSVYLGRPWQAYSRAIFIDTKMGPLINSAGWSQWSGNNNHLTAYFAEYNSMDLAGNPLNVSGRVAWSQQLTSEQAAAYSKEAWLAGTDGWNPVIEEPVVSSADFDGDGDIDGRDFLVWQRGFGLDQQSDNSAGDANFDGSVDADDLVVWQEQYGMAAPTLAAVLIPEPASWILLGAVMLVASSRR